MIKIKNKNKNKFTTFLCACLLAVGSLFGLVGAVGDTLAYTPSLIDNNTMQNYIVNYKNYDYNSIFDGYFRFNNFSTLTSGLGILFYDFNNNILSDLNSGGKITVSSSNFRSYGLNVINNIYQVTPNLSNYQIGVISTLFASSTTYLLDFANKDVKCLSFLLNDGNIYNFISVSQFQIYNAYKQGLSNGDNYDAAYSDGQNNVINNPNDYNLYTEQQYQQNYINGQNNVINNPNAFGLYTQQQYQQNYTDGYNAGVIQGQNNVINNPNDYNLNTNQQLQDSYNQGFADGEQSSDAYQNGYNNGLTDGQNNVINNPNDYNLFTQQQYDDNFSAGYNAGIGYALYGVFSDITYTVTQTQGNVILENALETYLNGYVLNPIYYGNVGSVTSSNVYFDINFNKPFTFNNQLSFTFNDVSQYYLEYTLVDTNNNSYRYYYQKFTDNVNVENPNVTIVNEPLKDVSTGEYITGPVLPGALIKKLTFSIRDNYIDKFELFIHQNSDDYNNGYNAGYELGFSNGSTSVDTNQVYQNGYNAGYSVGEQFGRYEGIASANDYSFISLFGALFDVPVKTLTGLLNFDLLGFNLFNFFTSLITLTLVIWLITKFI